MTFALWGYRFGTPIKRIGAWLRRIEKQPL